VGFLIRSGSVISLVCSSLAIDDRPSAGAYTAGYVLPGTVPAPGQAPLPADLEQAAVEQITYWFQNREHLGLKTYWPSGAACQQFAALDLLDSVKSHVGALPPLVPVAPRPLYVHVSAVPRPFSD